MKNSDAASLIAYIHTDRFLSRMTDRLTAKELAFRLRRHVSYVYAMKRRGFQMTGGTASMDEALRWLRKNGTPWSRQKK